MIARSNIPLHEQVKDDILRKIKDSTYKHGERIPSERDLSEKYGVSRVTIRNTITNLEHMGILERRHGSGTFVRETSVESQLDRMTSGIEQLEKMGKKVDIEFLTADYVVPDDDIREELEISKGDQVYRVVRRIFADGEPFVVSYIHTHVEVGRKMENLNMNKTTILVALEDFGYQIRYAKEKIHAVCANDFEMKMIEIDSRTPLLCIDRTVFVSQDRPLYVVKDLYRGDRYALNIVLQRNSSL